MNAAKSDSAEWAEFLKRVYSGSASVRETAVYELAEWHEKGFDIRELLAVSLRDSEPLTVKAAAIVAGRIRSSDPAILALLEEGLKSNKEVIRRTIAAALGRIGSPALPILIELMGEKDSFIRQFVASTITEIGKPAIELLVESLKKPDLRIMATSILADFGKASIDPLIALFESTDSEMRSVIAGVFEEIGPVALPQLMKMVETSGASNDMIAEVLTKFGADAVPDLLHMFKDESIDNRLKASELLVKIGKPAVSALLALLRETDTGLVWLASKTLSQMGAQAVPELLDSLPCAQGQVRWILFDILVQIGESAVFELEKIAGDHNSENREWAIHSLGEMGEVAWAALPALRKSMNDETDPAMKKILADAVEKLEIFD